MRLIDADELKKKLSNIKHKPNIRSAIELLDNAPTVEPTFRVFKAICCEDCEKRPHGKWEEVFVKRDILHPNGIKYICSACKRDNCYGKPPFCMWCGATMKSETECGADMRKDQDQDQEGL